MVKTRYVTEVTGHTRSPEQGAAGIRLVEAGLQVWFGGRMFALQGAGGGALVAFRAGENPAGRLHVRRRRSGEPSKGMEPARDTVAADPRHGS